MLLVVPDTDEVAGNAEGRPRDVEPAIAGQELVGEGVGLQEGDEALELLRVLRTDVGSAALKVLGVLDASDEGIYAAVAEAGVDDEGATDGLSGGLQQQPAAVGHVADLLDGGDVVGVLLHVQEFI